MSEPTTLSRSANWRADLVRAVLTADQEGELPISLYVDAEGRTNEDSGMPRLHIQAECIDQPELEGPELDPAQFQAVAAMMRTILAKVTPADLAPLASMDKGLRHEVLEIATETAYLTLCQVLGWDKLPTAEEVEQEAAQCQAEIDARNVPAPTTPAT